MAVKVFCSICEKFIKDVPENEIGTLNGREICEPCGKKVSTILSELDTLKGKHDEELKKAHATAMQKYKRLEGDYVKYSTKANDLYFRAQQELKDTLKDILER